jgi:poly(A) polymerase
MLPVVVPRAEHGLSRRDVDPDALKVLYRLKEGGFKAYLVGGGVRDLLLGRRPKDFDIGTDAHPHQIKRLFRNAWIIGRRFRLVHVKFGDKVVEVATFRRQVPFDEATHAADAEAAMSAPPVGDHDTHHEAAGHERPDHHGPRDGRPHQVHRDNSFGTDEEDAFRRDFTINALFYDISTYSIIDFVGGLEDLRAGVIRCIGDPDVRFHEDPVRMQRAVAFTARLGFTLDPPVARAIRQHGSLLGTAAPARLMDEYYKILRTGVSTRIFEALRDAGLLKALAPALHAAAGRPELQASLARLDAYRDSFDEVPAPMTSPILLGSLIVPLGFSQGTWPSWMEQDGKPGLNLGVVPLSRRDVERLHQVLMLQRRLLEPSRSSHARQMLMQRSAFEDALTWLEIHGDAPDTLAYWFEQMRTEEHTVEEPPPGRRRRRSGRRRRRAPAPQP